MKRPALVKREKGKLNHFHVRKPLIWKKTGAPFLPPHWSPKYDADEVARIRAELRLLEALRSLENYNPLYW